MSSADRRALVLADAASVQRQGDSAFVWKIAGSQLKKVNVCPGERDERRGEVVITRAWRWVMRCCVHPPAALSDNAAVVRVKLARRCRGVAAAPVVAASK